MLDDSCFPLVDNGFGCIISKNGMFIASFLPAVGSEICRRLNAEWLSRQPKSSHVTTLDLGGTSVLLIEQNDGRVTIEPNRSESVVLVGRSLSDIDSGSII